MAVVRQRKLTATMAYDLNFHQSHSKCFRASPRRSRRQPRCSRSYFYRDNAYRVSHCRDQGPSLSSTSQVQAKTLLEAVAAELEVISSRAVDTNLNPSPRMSHAHQILPISATSTQGWQNISQYNGNSISCWKQPALLLLTPRQQAAAVIFPAFLCRNCPDNASQRAR